MEQFGVFKSCSDWNKASGRCWAQLLFCCDFHTRGPCSCIGLLRAAMLHRRGFAEKVFRQDLGEPVKWQCPS